MQSFIGNPMPITCASRLTDTRNQRNLWPRVWRSSVYERREFLLKLSTPSRTPSSTLLGSQRETDSSSSLPLKSLHQPPFLQRPRSHSTARRKSREQVLATSSTSEPTTRRIATLSTGHQRAASSSLLP